MATINEDYVSFKTAKALKEKGFDEYCPIWYNLDKPIEGPFFYKEIGWYGHNSYDYNGKRIVSAPTLQRAMKWLREVHNIVVELFIREDVKYVWYIHRIEVMFNKKYLTFCWGSKNKKYEQYEEAAEAAIKYCLENLI